MFRIDRGLWNLIFLTCTCTKYPLETNLDPWNTRNKKFRTHKIPTRKNFGPLKYPRENISGARRHDVTTAQDHLSEAVVHSLANNIVNYLNEIVLGVNISKLDWHDKVCSEENLGQKISQTKNMIFILQIRTRSILMISWKWGKFISKIQF